MPSLERLVTGAVALTANKTGLDGIYHQGNDTAPCSSPLYCYGPVLGEIQLAKPFVDSKTYVDM